LKGELTLRALFELYVIHAERHFTQILTLRDLLEKPYTLTAVLEF
jgi:hypothetical protein